jgi:hypothetical protein
MGLELDPAAVLRRDGEAILAPPGLHSLLRIPLFDADVKPVTEAAGAGDAPQAVEPPAAIAGRIDPAGDVDRFAFAAKKGDRFNLAVLSASIGFPLDGVLTIEGPDGKELARADDERGTDFAARDARLEWIAPADGAYVATLSDLNRAGGPDYVYHLEIARPRPDFAAATETHSLKVDPGKSAEVKVSVARQNGHAGPLSVLVTGLPEGVSSTTAEVSQKGGTVAVTLSAAASAKPGGWPVRVSVVSPDEERPAVKHATFPLGEGQPVRRADCVWLTVGKPVATTAPAAEKK